MSDRDYDRGTGEYLPAVAEPQQMRNLIFASPECGEVFGALIEFQGACEAPKKTKTAKVRGQTRNGSAYEYEYAYAPLDEIHNAIRAPMKEAGLAYRQFLAQDGNQWVVRTIIAHRTGQWFGSDYPLFWDQTRGMQGFASGATYARRYGLMLALGIVAEDDDDANVADGQPATISGRNTAQTPQEGRRAQEAPRGTNGARNASGATGGETAAQQDASKRWHELAADIDNAMTASGLDRIPLSPAWEACRDKIADADGAKVAAEAMTSLEKRVARRREALRMEADPTDPPPP